MSLLIIHCKKSIFLLFPQYFFVMLTWIINIDVYGYGTIRIIATILEHLLAFLFTGEAVLQIVPFKNYGCIPIIRGKLEVRKDGLGRIKVVLGQAKIWVSEPHNKG